MKIGEIRQYIDQWHCGLYSEPDDMRDKKEIAHINVSKPFLVLSIDKPYFGNGRFWAKVLAKDKVGFIIISDTTTEIVR